MDPLSFGRFIKTCRIEKGMTQRELASRLNVTDKAISRWERGVGFPDIHLLKSLAEALGISPAEILQCERAEKANTAVEPTQPKASAHRFVRHPIALTWICVVLFELYSFMQQFLPSLFGYTCPSFLRTAVFFLLICGVLSLSYFYKEK